MIDLALKTAHTKKRITSLGHKLKRIRQQQVFKKYHSHEFATLTTREYEILTLLANDHNNPKIAKKLFISRKTVEQHRKNINRKLGIKTYRQLFQYALAFDLI